jgi:hypothetical protein
MVLFAAGTAAKLFFRDVCLAEKLGGLGPLFYRLNGEKN